MKVSTPFYTLGIESSCDDTAAAILCDGKVLSNCIANQEIHKRYGGVVPELASRAHQSNIIPVVTAAIEQAGIEKKQLNLIAFTQGPGLLGSLLVGSSFAKSLAMGLNIPFLAVNHMQGHLLASFIDHPQQQQPPRFPFLGVTVSGGHTQIVLCKAAFDMEVIGETQDDAIGEAFDKCGKIIGLPYPAGPSLDRLAQQGNSKAFTFPIPKMKGLNLSYSGIKTAFLNFIHKHQNKDPEFVEKNREDLCASLQWALVENIFRKIEQAVKETDIDRIVIGGGVSANSEIRARLLDKAKTDQWTVHLPPFEYTTDNAAMIGMVGYLQAQSKKYSDFTAIANPRLGF
jgi:N6-L-threonylcarbamoyladenine synthase